MGIARIYYGIWTMMLGWTVTARAALVIGFWTAVIYIFMPLLMKAFARLILILEMIVKYVVYPLCNAFAELVMKNSTLVVRAEALNKISGTMGRWSEWLKDRAKKVSRKRRISIIKVAIVYGTLIILIALPGILENKIDPAYLPLFSVASDTYHGLEKRTLSIASEQPPLFARASDEEETQEESTQTEPKQESTEAKEEIWLTLSEKGREGAYVREKPLKNSDSVTVISRDEKMIYLKKQDGWVKVRLENGKKGWIGESLLVGVPTD